MIAAAHPRVPEEIPADALFPAAAPALVAASAAGTPSLTGSSVIVPFGDSAGAWSAFFGGHVGQSLAARANGVVPTNNRNAESDASPTTLFRKRSYNFV